MNPNAYNGLSFKCIQYFSGQIINIFSLNVMIEITKNFGHWVNISQCTESAKHNDPRNQYPEKGFKNEEGLVEMAKDIINMQTCYRNRQNSIITPMEITY